MQRPGPPRRCTEAALGDTRVPRTSDLGADHVERPRHALAIGRVEQPTPFTHHGFNRKRSSALRDQIDRPVLARLDQRADTPEQRDQHCRSGDSQRQTDREPVDEPVHADRQQPRDGEALLDRDGEPRRRARERMILAEDPKLAALQVRAHRVRSTAAGGALELPTRGRHPTAPCSPPGDPRAAGAAGEWVALPIRPGEAQAAVAFASVHAYDWRCARRSASVRMPSSELATVRSQDGATIAPHQAPSAHRSVPSSPRYSNAVPVALARSS